MVVEDIDEDVNDAGVVFVDRVGASTRVVVNSKILEASTVVEVDDTKKVLTKAFIGGVEVVYKTAAVRGPKRKVGLKPPKLRFSAEIKLKQITDLI